MQLPRCLRKVTLLAVLAADIAGVWLDIEHTDDVAVAYRALVANTRIVAGGYMRSAWAAPGLNNDAGMNQPQPLDYSCLKQYEDAYLAAVGRALSWRYGPRRLGRWIKKRFSCG